MALAAAALLACIGIAIALVDPRSGGSAAVRLGADSVGVIDPGSGVVVAADPVGRQPAAIALGAGSAWVASPLDGTVTRIDGAHVRAVTIPSAPIRRRLRSARGRSGW